MHLNRSIIKDGLSKQIAIETFNQNKLLVITECEA